MEIARSNFLSKVYLAELRDRLSSRDFEKEVLNQIAMMTPESTLRELGLALASGDASRTEQQQIRESIQAHNLKPEIRIVRKSKRVGKKMTETSTTYLSVRVLHNETLYQAKWIFDTQEKIIEFGWKL